MLKQKYLKTYKNKNDFIAECEVLDDSTNETFYVVTQFGNLLYATFNSSYLDYAKGITKNKPKQIEGDDYFWYDQENTRFFKFYEATYLAASVIEKDHYIKVKYSQIKKPTGKIKYEIISKQSKCVMGCGPCGEAYEIDFYLSEEGKHLFVNSDDLFGYMSLSNKSLFKLNELEENGESVDYGSSIEEYENFDQTAESNYYDLFLEMEKYKDEIE